MSIAIPDMDIWRGKDWSNADTAELANRDLAEQFGWKAIAALMGGSLSITPVTIRPNQASCSPGTYYVAPVGAPGILDPYVGIDGQWYNRGVSWRPSGCDCADPRRVRLPGPVGRVEFVSIGGVVVPSTAYQVIDSEWLVRVDGGTWPRHQDMYAMPDAPNTFVVRYFQGQAPDDLDAYCAGVLAGELFKLLQSGDKEKCRLPRNVTNVVRQGVSYDLGQSGFADGRSGIPEVDAIVSTRNPYLLRTPSIVMSVDTMPHGRISQGPGLIAPTPPTPGGVDQVLVEIPGHPGFYQLLAA